MGKQIIREVITCCVIIVPMLLSACQNPEPNVLEEIAPAILFYFDEGEEKNLKVTTMVPPVKKEKRVVLSSEENLIKDTKKKLNSEYYREVKDGQLRLTFFNGKLAKKGIKEIIDSLYLDTEISDRVYLGVVEGDFEGLLKDPKNSIVDYLLFREMKHDRLTGNIYVRDLHQYLKTSHNPNSSPFLPLFKVSEDNNMKYSGLAIFKDHKLVDKVTLEEEEIFRVLHENLHYHEDIVIDPLQTSLGDVKSVRTYKLEPKQNKLSVQLVITCNVNEYQGKLDLSRRAAQLKLKGQIEEFVEKEAIKLLTKFQEKEVDPLSIGKVSRKLLRMEVKDEEWFQVWKELKLSVNVTLNIKDYGTYTPSNNGESTL